MPIIQTESGEKAKTNPKSRKQMRSLQKEEKMLERKQNREDKASKQSRKEEKRQSSQPIRRIFPIWLRLVVVLVLSFAALIVGTMVGFGVLGDGNPADALKFETWKHIVDIVVGEG